MIKELRILLIEDTAADAMLINHELRRGGLRFRSKCIETREEFLHEVEHHMPDVILSDHGVPGFDGFAALEATKELCPRVPFIFVTGAEEADAAVEPLKRGAADYVPKSRLARLPEAVRRALDLKRIPPRLAPSAEASRQALPSEQVAQIQTRIDDLEQQSRELREFALSMTNGMRKPLGHIGSFVDVLQKTLSGTLDPKSESSLRTISDSAREIARLLDQFQTFLHIQHTTMFHLRFSLTETAQEAIRDLRRETERRDIEWIIGELPQVEGDPGMLSKAFGCLLSNALKFTRRETKARIEIGSSETEQELIVFVADNGIGFDPANAQRVFETFKRLNDPEEFEGAGLGLAYVRRIIERHGGRVWAEGIPGQGAKFFLSIPKCPAPQPP